MFLTLAIAGIGINLFLTSLVTDMSFAVERLEQENSQFCQDGSAFTEAYALVDITFGAGTVFGPLISGLLYERTTWAITYGVLAVFCFSGSLPVVSANPYIVFAERVQILISPTDVLHRRLTTQKTR